MSGRRLIFVAMLAVLGGSAVLVDGQTGVSPPVSLSALIDQTVALFPKVEGEVVEVQGHTLTLSAGRASGVVSGLALEVYREGREIKHSRTGRVLGHAEENLGRAVVTRVFDGYSTATFDGATVAAGDHVRTTTAKIRVTLLSLAAPSVKESLVEAVAGELYEGLKQSGRFSVSLGEQVAPWLRQQGIAPDEFLGGRGVAEATRAFKIEHLIAVYVKTVEKKPFMEVRLFSSDRPDAALRTAMFVPSSIKPAQPGRFSSVDRAQGTPEKKPRSLLARLLGGDIDSNKYSTGELSIPLVEIGRVDFIVASMDVAVAPGDKIPRVALTDGDRVFVYKIENRALVGDWSVSARSMGRVFSVQFADLLGDGTLQVLANRFDRRLGMNSVIVGLRNGKPGPLVDHINGFLLGVDETGSGVNQALWVQPYSPEAFFTKGRVDKMLLRDGGLVRDRPVVVPENFRATGAALVSVTAKNQRVLAYIDEQNRLRVSSGSDEIWSSASVVGSGMAKIEVERYIERGGRSYFYQLEPNPLAIDLDGDGIQEVIIPQNQIEGMLMVLYRGPAGLRMQQVNSGFEGLITGLGGIRSEDGGPPALVAAVVRTKNLFRTSGTSQIIMTIAE